MKKILCLSITAILLSFCSVAQDAKIIMPRGPSLGVGAQMAVPLGEFADVLNGKPMGINAYVSIPFMGLPLETGFAFSWNRLNSESQDINITNMEGFSSPGELQIKGNSYRYQLTARLKPFNGRFRPYGEVLAGVSNFSSKTELRSESVDGSMSDPSIDRLERSFGITYGWAAGLQIRLFPTVFLEGRFEKLQGGKVEYLNPESVEISSTGDFSYSTTQTETDIYTATLGIVFSF